MPQRVLHLLSQRPSHTGSGITLDSLVRLARQAGWEQRVVVGMPHDDSVPSVGGLQAPDIHPLKFGAPPLDFPLPGMSDVMPYPSSRFSALTPAELERYRAAWLAHLEHVAQTFRPDVIHSHHIWILSSLVKDVFADIPVVTHCHGTCLRQMQLCPDLAPDVRRGWARNERFIALHDEQAAAIVRELNVGADRVHVVGAGFREDIFHSQGRSKACGPALLYAGKYSKAKGLPFLLDAVEKLMPRLPGLTLHVAGEGAGREAEELRARMARMTPAVLMHGQLSQEKLAQLMRGCRVFVLPSMFEGLPLVLAEARACGCRLVATELAGAQGMSGAFGETMELIPLPRLIGADVADERDSPRFVEHLTAALERALTAPPADKPTDASLRPFTWAAVFDRIERVWTDARERR